MKQTKQSTIAFQMIFSGGFTIITSIFIIVKFACCYNTPIIS